MMSSGKRHPIPSQTARTHGSLRLSAILEPQNNNFGVLRLGLALAVLVSHAYYLKTGSALAEPLAAVTGHSLGEHAVQMFFFLSGLMVAQSLDRNGSIAGFALGRGLRIFPGLIVCVCLTALALGPAMTRLPLADYFASPELIEYVWRTLSLSTGLAPLPGVFDGLPAAGTVNMSLWTLKYEVLCYAGLAAVAAAGLFAPQRRTMSAALLAVFIAVIFLKRPDALNGYSAAENVRYFALFFASGVLAYLLRGVLIINGVVLAGLGLVFWAALGTRFFELSTALFLGYAALYLAALPAGAVRRFCNRHDLSYGVYIYACPLQQVMVSLMPHASAEAQAISATLAVLPLAFASWTLVERPALQVRKKIAAAVASHWTPAQSARHHFPAE